MYSSSSPVITGEDAFFRHCERSEAIHMWTAPGLQGWRAALDRIACIHMSGLFDAVAHDRWPRWFPRREFHTARRRSCVTGLHGVSPVLDRSIHHLLVFLQAPATTRPAEVSPF